MIRRRKTRRMGAITLTHPSPTPHTTHHHGPLVEEIPSLLRFYKDGYVERPPLVPDVPPCPSPDPSVSSADVSIDPSRHLWARLYAPANHGIPLVVYFHGGGFCVGSPSWKCYHDFLAKLSSTANCAIASIGYRLAPEHRLPAAFEDGLNAVSWLLSPAPHSLAPWWSSRCNSSSLFLAGDSAGATIAYHVASLLGSTTNSVLRGVILIQPFFGGEERTWSERNFRPPLNSALTLATSDAYWRLALPAGANRDHAWCNPMEGTVERLKVARVMVCIAEMDILKDRGLELCRALRRAGKSVEEVMHGGVGHAFQVLSGKRVARMRADEMVMQIRSFVQR